MTISESANCSLHDAPDTASKTVLLVLKSSTYLFNLIAVRFAHNRDTQTLRVREIYSETQDMLEIE